MKSRKQIAGAIASVVVSSIFFLQGYETAAIAGDSTSTENGREPAGLSAADIGAVESWGGADRVVQVKHLFLSDQPDAEALKEAADRGVGDVINLRGAGEMDWDEPQAAADAGMTYYRVPIARSGASFDVEAIHNISSIVKKHSDQRILLHCSSGNRAGAWLAIHLVRDHGMEIEASISLARLAGITSPAIEVRTRQYLDGDQSVRRQSD